MWANGTIPARTSSRPARVSGTAASWRSIATRAAWLWIMLLGSPVVPLELQRNAVARGSPASVASGSPDGSDSSGKTVSAAAAALALGSDAASATTYWARVWETNSASSRDVSIGLAGATVRPATSAPNTTTG